MSKNETILLTGGAGYIGSVTSKILLERSYNVIVVDNLSTGYKDALSEDIKFYQVSTLDKEDLKTVFEQNLDIKAIMHFASNIEVGESVINPSKYFYNNVVGGLNIIDAAREYNIEGFIFSSTAAVYGEPKVIPIPEDSLTSPINPYGVSKLHLENYLKYYFNAYKLKHVILRYFNACGAYKNLGENHHPESHLIPNAIKSVLGGNNSLNIWGNKYNTPDGTPIRDYIAVEDIANAHILALEAILSNNISNEILNIGNGLGYSVMEIVQMIEKVTGKKVPYTIKPARPGDTSVLIAGIDKIQQILHWKPMRNLEHIISSAYEWHKNHPNGYEN